jgi:hypothetical protein
MQNDVRAGKPQAILPDKMGFLFGKAVRVSARHWLTYRDVTTSAADSTYWIPRVPYPILLTRGQAAGEILQWEPQALLSAAHERSHLCERPAAASRCGFGVPCAVGAVNAHVFEVRGRIDSALSVMIRFAHACTPRRGLLYRTGPAPYRREVTLALRRPV